MYSIQPAVTLIVYTMLRLHQYMLLVSGRVHGLNVEVVYGKVASFRMDSRPVDSCTREAERGDSITGAY